MNHCKAEGGRRKAEGGMALAVVAMLLFAAAGCTDRISPAAPTANIEVAANNDREGNASAGPAPAQTPEPVPGQKTDTVNDQLARAISAAPTAPSATQDKPAITSASRRTRDINFDDIKFEMKKEEPFFRSMLTPKIEKLFGNRIRVRGYIHPAVYQQTDLTQFVLVRDNQECCFGPGAALYDAIVIEMAPSKSTDFTNFPVTVEGVFTLEEIQYPDPEDETKQKHLAIYHMVADKVR